MANRKLPRHRNPSAVFLLAALLSSALPSSDARAQAQGQPKSSSKTGPAAPAAVNEQALAALKEMSSALASAKTLRFKVRSLIPMKTASGAWITLIGEASVMRAGNDKLHVETGGDLFPFQLFFDGKSVTAFSPEKKVYARRDASGTIDEALAQAAKNGEAYFVFADLVSADPYAAMTKGLQSAIVVGTSTVDGREAQHLAARGKALEWEVWIGTKDRLPRMVTLTDTGDARKPTQIVLLSDWELDQSLPADAFSFNAPADATQIPFGDPAKRTAIGRRPPQAGEQPRARPEGTP
jgi:hypothetical protein